MSLWIDLDKNTILFCGKEFLRCQWKDFCIYISVYTSRTAEALGAGQGSWRRPPAWSWTRRWRAPCVTRHRRGQAEAAETDELRFGAMIDEVETSWSRPPLPWRPWPWNPDEAIFSAFTNSLQQLLVLLLVTEADGQVQHHPLGRGLGLELSMIRNVGPLSLRHLHHEQKHARGVAA